MGELLGLIIGVLIAAVISGFIIWIVSKLNLGLKVANFGWAMLAGLLIGIVTNLILHFVPGLGGIAGFIVNLVVAAAVIFLMGQVLQGLTVDGFVGALIAALAIAAIGYGLGLLLAGMMQAGAA